MGLRGRDNSFSDIAKRVTATSPSMNKKHVVVQREEELPRPISGCSQTVSIGSQIQRMGPICTARKKVVSLSPQLSIEEDVDFVKQLGKERFSSAADDSMWLSSGCISPSSFFEEHESSSPFHLVADECLVSWLSTLADSYVSLSKGASLSISSKTKPEEDKSLALAKVVSGKIAREGLEDEGEITWQLHPRGNYGTGPPAESAERIKSSCGQCSDESSSDGNCLTSHSTNLDSSSQVSDTDTTSFMASILNLDEDGFHWISNTELELDYFQSCFPSPSSTSFWDSEAKSSTSTTINRKDEITEPNLSLEQTSEAENVEDFSADEPLFWPFDRKIDWNSEETWEYFSMSPRKEIIKVTTSEGTSPRSIDSELNNRNVYPPNRCRRKLALKSGSTASKILELNRGNKGCDSSSSGRVKRGNAMPSRLRESTNDSAKIVPLDIDNQILPLKVGEVPTTKSILTGRNFWEDEFSSNEELSIEAVLGLGEFDGHEGIDSEFNEGVFFLDEAL
ncbi:PREDICTED: uncharacterized protein LOC18602544 [Theobroma cacao]|uniref:Uncharacterized protein LOC18602544 n=1 Tax=Theobroma cacao TaxID=3641 RepID=A0AB32W5V2_THECC|nr:PREDICTED: uncharacterized protein LOC18602544 [Theobroma cacao]